MRIPSEFNDESLYRRRPRRGDNADSYRRIVRMVIGLALVLVVMRQAARPAIYEAFFGDQAAEPTVPVTKDTKFLDVQAAELAQLITAEVDAEHLAVAAKVNAELRPSDRRQWLVALTRWQTSRAVEIVPSTVDSVRSTLDSDTEDPARSRTWHEMIDALESRVASGEGGAPEGRFVTLLASWVSALDDAAASEVVDGSVWRSGDFDSFYRYLDEAPWMSAEDLPATGVLPLLQQPDVYRTQMVRVAGGVARAERMQAQENPFGISEYWQLWLRPSDGADRPLLVIVPDVPQEVERVGPVANLEDGPPVVTVGRFLKRLAYPSKAGADLAPVVIGRLIAQQPPQADLAANSTAGSDDSSRLLILVGLAVVVGVLVAVVAMWRTGIAAKRSREIRNAHRKEPNLKELQSELSEELS